MALRGFKLSLFSAYQIASRSGIISHFRKTEDTIHHALGIDLPAIHATLETIEKSAYRLIYLAGYPTPEGRRFAVVSTSPSLYPQRYAYELTFDALKGLCLACHRRWLLADFTHGVPGRRDVVVSRSSSKKWPTAAARCPSV